MSNFDRMKELMSDRENVGDYPEVQSQPGSNGRGDADYEMKQMLDEVDLLSIIQDDAGEQGHASGDRVDFENCPVCGHNECFRFYPNTNSWSCFGDSNETGYDGGSALEYMKATRGYDDIDAVKWLREATGYPYEPKAKDMAKPPASEQPGKPLLPGWCDVRASNPPKRNPPLIHGLLRRRHVMGLVGKAKSTKTTSADELSMAVAFAGEWFGFKCEQGNVLFIDPENDAKSIDARFAQIAEKLDWADPALVDERIKKWSLRGVLTSKGNAPTIADLAHDIEIRCAYGDFALVVIDSASCFIAGEENSAGDMRRFFAHVLRIAEVTGAAVLVIHHFGKGDKGDWDPIDRARGSAVWGDAPDAPMSLIEIFPPNGKPSDYIEDGERAFMLEDSGLREFKGIEPRHLIFNYPIHRVDAEGITDNWRPKSGKIDGGRATGKSNQMKSELRAHGCESALVAELMKRGLPEGGIPAKEAAEIAADYLGENVNAQTLKTYVENSSVLYPNQVSKQRWCAAIRPELTPALADSQPSPDLSD